MRQVARILAASAGAAVVTAVMLGLMGLMNLGGREPARLPAERPLYRPYTVRKALSPPLAPRKAPAAEARAEKPARPPTRAPVRPAESARPAESSPVESRLSARAAPGIGGDAVPAPAGLFEPKVFPAPSPSDAGSAENPGPAPEKGVFTARDLDTPPEVASRTKPSYPSWAAERGVTGSVTLKFLVSREGVPEEIMALDWTGDAEFAESAKSSMKQWRFKPGKRGGKPVAFWCRITIRFEQ